MRIVIDMLAVIGGVVAIAVLGWAAFTLLTRNSNPFQ